jgi:hypothetical protein
MPDEVMDAQVDSSTTDTTTDAATAPAPSTQVAPPVDSRPFHEHPRFRELTTANREMKAQIAALTQRMQQTQQQGQPMAPEEAQQYQQAAAALKRLIGNDPELRGIFDLLKQAPQFQQRFQGIDAMQAQAARAHTNAARSAIKELAAADGLPTDDASLRHIVRLVAGEAMSLEQGNERYSSGDLSVLEEAFTAIKPWLSAMRKPAEATVAQTKNKTKGLPPAPRGGVAGQPAPAKLEPGKERAYEADMHSRARKMLESLQG